MADDRLILATSDGVLILQRDRQGWRELRRGLVGQAATSVIAREGVILAGTRQGIYRSADFGSTWSPANAGLSISHIRWLAFHPEVSDFELAGTEPAAIFISRDGGDSWRECPQVAALRQQYGWSLPYSPEAGCVRGFALRGQRAYAAVEDGGVLLSDQHGETWRLAPGSRGRADHRPASGFIHSDVHSIEVHPSSPDLVFAPTGGGLYRSEDGGRRWDCIYPNAYCRAVWLDPQDPHRLLCGPADGVDYNGRIETTLDGGRSWQPSSAGLPVPWHRTMVERFVPAGADLFAILSNGELLSTSVHELAWRPILPASAGVAAAAWVPAA